MKISIDTGEITAWAAQMANPEAMVKEELLVTHRVLLGYGVGRAVSLAPVREGGLRGSIGVMNAPKFVGNRIVGSYGTDLVYAHIREFGGVIRPRTKGFLAWQDDRTGKWIFTKKPVVQSGRPYMFPSADAVQVRMGPAYDAAVARILKRFGAS